MAHLTLQEVVDRINQICSSVEDRQAHEDRARNQKHRPEFYIPRITRRLARFIFSTQPQAVPQFEWRRETTLNRP